MFNRKHGIRLGVVSALIVGVLGGVSSVGASSSNQESTQISRRCQIHPQKCITPTPTTDSPSVSVSTTPTSTTTTVTPSPSTTLPNGYTKVVFYDDFSSGLSKWNVRNNTWANNEYSIDTNRSVNVTTNNGDLEEIALREKYTAFSETRQFTSAYLDTIGKFSQQYGRWEMRAELPANKGLWPAFWLRGNNGAGELDIMESVGGTDNTVQTIHQSTYGDGAKAGHEDSSVADLTAWHTYAIEREPGYVRWYIDNRLVFSETSTELTWLESTFNEPMNIRLNLQVGGSMPKYYNKDVDSTTVFPAKFVIDYVRVLTK